MVTVNDVKIIELPKFLDARGNLSFAEQLNHIPFEIKRTYWIYDVPGGEERGGHAFKGNQEFIVALSGAFDVVVDDGQQKKTFSLNRSYYGLYVPAGLWREINNFSTNSLALEFGSEHYSEEDYIREYDEYLRWREESSKVQEFKSSRVVGRADGTPRDLEPLEQLKPLEPCPQVQRLRLHHGGAGQTSQRPQGQPFRGGERHHSPVRCKARVLPLRCPWW